MCVCVCVGVCVYGVCVCEQPISASAANGDKAIMCCMLQVPRHCLVTTQRKRERKGKREGERWREMYPIDVQGIEGNPGTVALAVDLALVMAARVEQIKVPL